MAAPDHRAKMIYRLRDGRYPPPGLRFKGEALDAASLARFSMPVDEALGPSEPAKGKA